MVIVDSQIGAAAGVGSGAFIRRVWAGSPETLYVE